MIPNHSKLKTVAVVLENCESYTFRAENVNLIVQNLGLNCWGQSVFLKAEHIMLEIEKVAKPFSDDSFEHEDWQNRISQDITQIILAYDDGTQYTLWPAWSDESDYENTYETDQVSDNGMEMIYIISPLKSKPCHFEL